ncbi:uncharacterized protein BX663DRAFT_517981 [Cokeromyces recurvatus]|uniref:uncharacterized protein n=1 Tax=Cokeromyces recurvatus TaxID=90255 RepID=UPI00221E5745|nr:uncharacterized protein BX663DRAFT_517981 [Cokeromyces recurvatus]KAI7900229.1 hypothetical protein BX663DRAFT_517981 [Cokeromyces recurvatus]
MMKDHLESSPLPCITTPPVPFVNMPEEENNSSLTEVQNLSSPPQAIAVTGTNNNHLQTSTHGAANGRNSESTALLSTTLVGSPIFDNNLLSTPSNSNA